MVPRSMLKEWALHTFPNATDYWTFRKMFTIQLALIGLAEFMLHLNRLNPEMLQIAQVRDAWECQILLRKRGVMMTGHSYRCIKRSPLPSLSSSMTYLYCDIHAASISRATPANAKDVLTEHYIPSLCALDSNDISISRECLWACTWIHTHTRTHKWCPGSADSFLKVIIKDDCVSQPDLPSDPNRPLLTGVTSGS